MSSLRTAEVWSWLFISIGATAVACGSPQPGRQPEEGLVQVNGTELFVKRIGSGDPIMIVHGGPVLEHGYLLPHLEPLADSYELIFFDQRLSGRSAGTVDSASVRLATFAADIEGLRQELGLGDIHLMGHSWGGLLAMSYAIRHGDHLRSLLLLNSIGANSALWQEEQALVASRITDQDRADMLAVRETEAFEQREPAAVLAMLLISYRPQFFERANLEALELYVPLDYADRSRQFGFMSRELMSFDLTDGLAKLVVPTLIIYGEAEPAVAISAPALHTSVPNSELVIVPQAGHFPFVEQADTTLAAIRGFLAAVH